MSSDGYNQSKSAADVIITAANVSKRYVFTHRHAWSPFGRWHDGFVDEDEEPGYLALNNVSFMVKRGETVGVLGKNGAGKSTLLQILTGVLQPTEGSVEIKGRVGALLELGAGFDPELTGRENVRLVGAALGLHPANISEKLPRILEFADIGEFIDRPVKTYSSGMLVRLAFSLQIQLDPDVLIIDEALSVGDMFFQQKCLAKLRELIDRGTTVFFVSHSLNAVKSLCQRALLLQGGGLVADGPADEVCALYQNSMSSTDAEDLSSALATTAESHEIESEMCVQANDAIQQLDKASFDAMIVNRSGGGELRFTGFSVLDPAGNPTSFLEEAGRVRLHLHFKVNSSIPAGTALGLLIRDMHGVDLLALNSNFYGRYLPELEPSDSTYIWEIETILPLAAGRYSFHCGAKPAVDTNYFYDRCFNIGVLDILSNPAPWGSYGGRLLIKPKDMSLFKNS